MPEARFNQALALSRLGLRQTAVRAWNELLRLEPGGETAGAATIWIERLGRPGLEQQWPRARRRLLEATAPESVRELVERFPFRTRLVAERELLPQWARERLAGMDAERKLQLAERIGSALLLQRGDATLADAVGAIRRAENADPDLERATLEGLVDFGDGMAAYEGSSTAAAEKRLLEAADKLDGVAPLAGWARFHAAICRYYEDVDAGARQLLALETETADTRWLALRGRIQWLLGTIDVVQNRLARGVSRYRAAHALLDRASGPGQAAFIHVLLAAGEASRGRHWAAWDHRLVALRDVPRFGTERRMDALLGEAQESLVFQGQPDLAMPFLDEQLLRAETLSDAFGLVQTLINRAEVLTRLGRHEAAQRDALRARLALDRIPEGPLVHDLASQLLLARGFSELHRAPRSAERLIAEALAMQAERGYLHDRIKGLVWLGRTRAAAGDPSGARGALEEAIALLHGRRLETPDPLERWGGLQRAQEAHDTLLELLSDRDTSSESWLQAADRARERTLSDLRREAGRAGELPDQVGDLLEPHEALLHYTVLPRSLVILVARRENSMRVRLDIGRDVLERRTATLLSALESGLTDAELHTLLGSLYDILVAPVREELSAATDLLVVPDGPLKRVPFAALWSRHRRRYLVDDFAVAESPSAALSLSTEDAHRCGAQAALVVYDRGGAEIAGRALPPLSAPPEEARAIARSYAVHELLTGAAAHRRTREAIGAATVFHFAGHALPGQIWGDEAMLVIGPGEPLNFRALRRSLPGRLRLVVLSACRTLSGLTESREGALGLAGLFFGAGVPSVLASRWWADDSESKALMVEFHRIYSREPGACGDAARALRHAILELRRTGRLENVRSWANFTVLQATLGASARQ